VNLDRDHFYSVVRTIYPKVGLTQPQVDGLNFLLGKFEVDDRMTPDQRWIAYALATTARETGHEYEPIQERGPRRYFDKYNHREDLGHHGQTFTLPDGSTVGIGYYLRGRGYCQLTGLVNYEWFSNRLGIDLISNPELACDRQVAYQVMVIGMTEGRFTGKKLRDYILAQKCSYFYARRIINGLDRASEVAGYARTFEKALKAA